MWACDEQSHVCSKCQLLSRLDVREEILESVHAYRHETNKKKDNQKHGAEGGFMSVEALPQLMTVFLDDCQILVWWYVQF